MTTSLGERAWVRGMLGPAAVFGILLSILMLAGPAAVAVAPAPSAAPSGSAATLLTTDILPLPTSAPQRNLPATTLVSLTLTLANPRSGELDRYLNQVEDPASSYYRHFLSYPEFVNEFAPPAATVVQVEASLESSGARDLAVAPDRSSMTVVLPAASVDRLLGVQLVSYGSDGRIPLYTAVGVVSLPPSWEGLVTGIDGLSDSATVALAQASRSLDVSPRPWSSDGVQFVHDNTSGEDWFVGSDYTQAYGATALFPGGHSVPNATYPRSVAIATLLGSAYNLTTQTDLPPWDPAVLQAYFNGTLDPAWPMPNVTGIPVDVNGVTPPPPGSFGSQNDSTLYEVENSLDLEMAGSLAPGSSLYNFYFAGSLLQGSATVGDAANYIADDLARALAYNYGPAHLAVVSCSFGLPDLNNSAWNAELLTAAATGVTVLSASGDQGNAPDSLTHRGDGQWPVWPATAAWNTSGSVSVGGVSITLSGSPSAYFNGSSLNLSYDPSAGQVSSASTWYDTLGGPGAYAGSEGGASTVIPEPYLAIPLRRATGHRQRDARPGRLDPRTVGTGRGDAREFHLGHRLSERHRGDLLLHPRRNEHRGSLAGRIVGRRGRRREQPVSRSLGRARVPRPRDLSVRELFRGPSRSNGPVHRRHRGEQLRLLGRRRVGRDDGLGRGQRARVPRRRPEHDAAQLPV